MRVVAGLLALVFAAAESAVAQTDDLKVEASLSGYGLLWPSSHCCAFKMAIDQDGVVIILVENPAGARPEQKTYRYVVTREEVQRIRVAIESSQFFALPREVGEPLPVDGEMRTILVQRGARRHEVLLSTSNPQNPSGATERRAVAVWRAVRSVMRTDERLNADPMEP